MREIVVKKLTSETQKDEKIWVEKYRPLTIDDCILPNDIKQIFKDFVATKEIPNLLLSGPPGIGKTTVARALLEEMKVDYIMINGSMDGNIDTLRHDIKTFASTMSLLGGRKYVLLDEADWINAKSTQPALRSFMEEFSKNCGFIFTCNYRNKILPALQSRSAVVEFMIDKKDRPQLAMDFFNRCEEILKSENVEYNEDVIVELITRYFPDWRRVLNELQKYSKGSEGIIDIGILSSMDDDSELKMLMELMRDKKFTELRNWVGENLENENTAFFRNLYNVLDDHLDPKSVPQAILILADYMYRSAFCADHEINLVACLVEIMGNCEFKF